MKKPYTNNFVHICKQINYLSYTDTLKFTELLNSAAEKDAKITAGNLTKACQEVIDAAAAYKKSGEVGEDD